MKTMLGPTEKSLENVHQALEELEIKYRQCQNDLYTTQRENKENSVKYLEMLQEYQNKNKELEELKNHLEELVDARAHELKVTNENLKKEIDERNRAEEALQEAKSSAEQASRAKSSFLANMSHEMRTPMNSIIGMCDLLIDMDLGDEVREYLNDIHFSSNILLHLINDILDLSKIEAGKFAIELVSFKLRGWLNNCADLFKQQILTKELIFTCNVDRLIPDALIGDFYRLQQIMVNLIGNSIKFTESGGTIAVTATLVKDHVLDKQEILDFFEKNLDDSIDKEAICLVEFSITDTGIGIDHDLKDRIFEVFEQEDASLTRHFGGTGLGLSIAQKLVKLLGGDRISVESEKYKGSTFSFTIPLIANFEFNQEDSFDTFDASRIEVPPLRILAAEDNHINRKLICKVLQKMGHSVSIACDGNEAVGIWKANMRSNPFDLVIMDVQMPEKDGHGATKEIRDLEKKYIKETSQLSHVPIIALTANALKGDREKCMIAGMDGYLSKPIKKKELLREIVRFHGKPIGE